MTFATMYSRAKLPGLEFKDKSRTIQADKKDADINNIMKKFKTTGQLPELIKTNPQYGDFSEVGDYLESMNIVMKANEQFNALSADIRKRFDNDPAKFLEFCSDNKNVNEMIKLGLAEKLPLDNTQDIPAKAAAIPKETQSKAAESGASE